MKEGEGSGSQGSPGFAKRLECGDVYFADRGQSSHSYPTLWMVLSSKSALEPNIPDIFGPEANWYCLSAPAGDMNLKRGMAPGRWQGKGYPDSPHVLQTQELGEMIYVGNFYEWAQSQIVK